MTTDATQSQSVGDAAGGYRARHRRDYGVEITEYWSQIKALDFLLGCLVVFTNFITTATPAPPGVMIAAFICAWAICKRPQRSINWGGVILFAGVLLYVYLIAVSVHGGMPWAQRITKFVLLLGLAAAVAQKRIDVRSFILGTCMFSVVNLLLFYAGVTPNLYPPYLTGYYDDKNVSGFYYALFGVLGLWVMTKWWARLWIAFSLAAVVLTGSRTSISAFLLAMTWVLLRNRVSPFLRVILTATGFWLLVFVEQTMAQIGVFSDRVNTDWFRAQIDMATQAKMDETPWYGMGLNQGFVVLGGVRRMWFHDSYAQAFVEGGYLFLGATVFAFAIVGLGVFSKRHRVSTELLVGEAAMVVVLVCAWKLGEVFMTVGAFFALGFAVGARFGTDLSPEMVESQARRSR